MYDYYAIILQLELCVVYNRHLSVHYNSGMHVYCCAHTAYI